MRVVVGRVGRAHGLRGAVTVDVRTDDPDHRFAPGAVLDVEGGAGGTLTVTSSHWHSGRLLVTFDGANDRTGAEALRGTLLAVDVSDDEPPIDPDEFYDHHLVGLRAQSPAGETLGVVTDVVHLPAQDLLSIRREGDGGEALVPFVAAIVPAVDVAGGFVVVDAPAGLLHLDDEGA